MGDGIALRRFFGRQRTLTFEIDGDVKRRYQYGPTGDVLFEQVFNATGNPTLQAEQDLLVPLGDHQHTTWLALAHAVDDATYVRQSYDVSSFGRNLDTFGADGLPEYSGRVATHGFQGMVYDVQAGHYRTDARVYDPHLGRFISVDPIHDGSNWYMFAGNNPVNFADPSGLSLQGYPLRGGYSGNVTKSPTIGGGNIYSGGDPLGGGPALSPSLNNFLRGAVKQALNPIRIPSTNFSSTAGSSILSSGPQLSDARSLRGTIPAAAPARTKVQTPTAAPAVAAGPHAQQIPNRTGVPGVELIPNSLKYCFRRRK